MFQHFHCNVQLTTSQGQQQKPQPLRSCLNFGLLDSKEIRSVMASVFMLGNCVSNYSQEPNRTQKQFLVITSANVAQLALKSNDIKRTITKQEQISVKHLLITKH